MRPRRCAIERKGKWEKNEDNRTGSVLTGTRERRTLRESIERVTCQTKPSHWSRGAECGVAYSCAAEMAPSDFLVSFLVVVEGDDSIEGVGKRRSINENK